MAPVLSDPVQGHYQGTLMDGMVFDSSYQRGVSRVFHLKGVIPFWRVGLQKMKPGGKARLVCRPDIACGGQGAGGQVPPNATLVFEVELLRVAK